MQLRTPYKKGSRGAQFITRTLSCGGSAVGYARIARAVLRNGRRGGITSPGV